MNPHGRPLEPKSSASANSATRAKKNGDSTGNRTRDTAVKGRCLNLLTMEPPKKSGNVLLSRAASRQVSSALRSLTSVFDMVTGVSSRLLLPHKRASPSKLNNFSPLTLNTSSLTFLNWSSVRPISIGQLNILLCLHLRPIYVLVFHGSYQSCCRKSFLVGGFALRCFQRLSRPYLATRLCTWQYNRYTRGMSIPVLSY